MEQDRFRSDAFECLFRRYIKEDPKRVASFQEELVKSQIAREIYDLRNNAGLTRDQMATLADTTASVIEDIEEADFEGDFLLMASRIAAVMKRKIEVRFVPVITPESREAMANVDQAATGAHSGATYFSLPVEMKSPAPEPSQLLESC